MGQHLKTRVGDLVTVGFNAKRGDELNAPPLVRARLSKPLRVMSVWDRGVRVGGGSDERGQWHLTWIRVA